MAPSGGLALALSIDSQLMSSFFRTAEEEENRMLVQFLTKLPGLPFHNNK